MAYSEKVIDHYENPRNVGTLDKNDPSVGTGLVGAPACGDVMKLQIKISDEGIIEDAKFKTFGCGSAIASSSLVTEWVKGMTIDQAMEIKNTQIAEELSLPPVKIHCSVLAEDAIKAAIADYKAKRAAEGRPGRQGPKARRGRAAMAVGVSRAAPSPRSGRRSEHACHQAQGPARRHSRRRLHGLFVPVRVVRQEPRPEDKVLSFEDGNVQRLHRSEELPVPGRLDAGLLDVLVGRGFKFENPNVKGSCGCGESVSF